MFQLVTPVLGIAFALCSAGIQTAISRFCAAKKFQSTWLFAGLAVALPLSVLFTSFTYAYADFIAVRIFLNKDARRKAQNTRINGCVAKGFATPFFSFFC